MKEFDTAKVDVVIADLAKAGFHVTSGDGCLNVIDFEPAQAGEEPDCMVLTAEEKLPCKRVFRTDEHLLYLVLPSKAWDDEVQKAVAANSRSWILEGRRRCDQFERILSGHGYRAGAVGGNPPNMDYNSPCRQVIFFYRSNPYHS
jgi:hypothetical protein